jgi:hypothetical protein
MLSRHKRDGDQAPKTPARIILKRPTFLASPPPPCRPTTREILKKTETDRAEIFWRKKLEKQNADICRCGRKIHAGIATCQRHGGRGDHLYGARAPAAGRGFAPIDASRGDDERVFDSLHRAGIDIKLVGNPTNGPIRSASCGKSPSVPAGRSTRFIRITGSAAAEQQLAIHWSDANS